MPPMPIKCAGAPQKIMYLFEDHLRKVRYKERSANYIPQVYSFGLVAALSLNVPPATNTSHKAVTQLKLASY